MLGKLMKYEIKATARVFLPLYGALIMISIINRIFMRFSFTFPASISTVISSFMIGAICVITLVITLKRFRRNLLSSEGYLMFTLPVGTDSLIVSKLLISALWFIISSIVIIISISVMNLTQFNIEEILNAIYELFRSIHMIHLNYWVYGIEAIFICVLSLLTGILMLYACISLSLLSNNHRGLTAFGVFIGFNIIGQWLCSMLVLVMRKTDLQQIFSQMTEAAQLHSVFLTIIIGNLILGGIFYFINRYMLVNKLNLE